MFVPVGKPPSTELRENLVVTEELLGNANTAAIASSFMGILHFVSRESGTSIR
jgi:hypothetical protein